MKIGIDLGGTNVRVALVDNFGIVNIINEPCKADKTEREILDHIKEIIHRLIIPGLEGIGIGVPSTVDTERGIVYDVLNIPSWKKVYLKQALENEFHLPTFVNNDANCFVLGEKYYGAGKPYKNLIGVTIGTGVGSGVIIDNKLYAGNNTCAGEIGCLPYMEDIYEHYCSSQYFVTHHNTTGKQAYYNAANGDEKAIKIWNMFGTHIGALVSAILYTYDPEAIVFGGSISAAYKYFAPAMKEKLKEFMFSQVVKKIFITTSNTENVGILGAASLVNT